MNGKWWRRGAWGSNGHACGAQAYFFLTLSESEGARSHVKHTFQGVRVKKHFTGRCSNGPDAQLCIDSPKRIFCLH